MFIAKVNDTVIFPDPVFNLQYNAVFGNNRHFFEIGAGAIFPGLSMNLRIGYRLQIEKHFLFKIAYTPAVYLVSYYLPYEKHAPFIGYHGLSVGLGYRFGIRQQKTPEPENKNFNKNSFSIFLETPLFFEDWHGDAGNVGFINFEYLNRRNSHYGNSYSVGVLFLARLYNEVYTPGPIFDLQYNAVFGRHTNFFELGIGFVVPDFILNLRIGYRLQIKKHFLFKIAYTPSIYLEPWEDSEYYRNFAGIGFTGFHGLSVGIGYRLK